MKWINSPDKKSLTSDNPIILLKSINDADTTVFDTIRSKEIDVKLKDGIPYCRSCESYECAHVGFVICVEQLYCHCQGHEKVETVDDIV